ncbi:TonB-dependent receptor plug domain-containing protein [Xanthomonas campestris]|uniref:TonB-dependent receptor plug domain-containing protein n=1 Tax=Xanthomonas campestris TaxID=339 RepID=UPI000E1F32C4|nr:TonB-dependent receptor [Xanthomonas campestris]
MNSNTHKLRDAIVFALAASPSLYAGGALAQDAGGSTTNLDRIEVTGSRIRQTDTETAQPVLTISRADIERQGFQSVGDILQNVSAVGTPPISRASPLSSGENTGGTFISLRNLGAARTLVLVNGKRLGISTSGLSDIGTIPAVAVERIEILKDGASSTYGSDAIAGVINIITRSNYDGAAAGIYFGQYSQGDGDITNGSFVLGVNGDRGSLTVAAEYAKEDVVRASDRDFSEFPRSSLHPTDNWTTVGQVGGFTTTATTAIPGLPTGTRVVLRDGGDPRNRADYRAQNIAVGGCTPATAANPGPGGCVPGSVIDKSNTNQQTDLRTPLERKSIYVNGLYELTDSVRFRTDMLYSNREADRTVAGYPMQAASFATPMSAQSYFNPTGATITNWFRRTWEVPRVSNSDLTTFRFTGAFEGSFEIKDRFFDWDVSYLRNSNRLTQNAFGNLNLTNTRQAVGPSFLNPTTGQVSCGVPGTVVIGCVPFNPFLPFGVEGAGALTNNEALRNYLFQEEHSTGRTDTTVFSANLSGSIVTLPAGDLGFAIGYENRKEEGSFSPDALAQTGASTNLSAGPTGGSYSVDEVYAELQVPILADLPFAKELSLNLASRYSKYDTFGETTNNKFGLKWRPFDSLLLRGTYADGFRAPTISDLYGGGSQTFLNYTDPCDTLFGSSANNATTRANCARDLGALANNYRQLTQGFVPATAPNTQTPVPFTSGSNPTLTPEISRSQTIGAVWSPGFVEGLNVSLDWWKIRIDSTIVADTPNDVLIDCYVQSITSRCAPELFTRDPVQGFPTVTFGNRNAGFRKVEGFDFDIGYRWASDTLGKFSVNSNSTYTVKDYLVSTNDPRFALSSVGFTSTFRVRSNLNLGWQKDSWSATWTTRYFSSMKETCTYFTPSAAGVAPVTDAHLECNDITFAPTGALLANGDPASALARRRKVGSNTFHDVQIAWEAPWKATISLGANNVFNHIGPVMYSQPSANVSYYGGFDIGRFLYMRYNQRF